MLPIQFPENSSNMRYEYHRVREGPNYFISYYKNSSRLHYDPKDCWRTLAVAKFTDTGKALKEWCLEMYETYSVPQIAKWSRFAETGSNDELGTPDTSFASEIESEPSEEPNDNTKMVT